MESTRSSHASEIADVLARTLPRIALSQVMDELPDDVKRYLNDEDCSLRNIEEMLHAQGTDVRAIVHDALERILPATPHDHLFQYCNAALQNTNPFRDMIKKMLTAIATARSGVAAGSAGSSDAACGATPSGRTE